MLVLDGVKVLDMSNFVPGALCTMILADMGAEVIKIEPAIPFPLENLGYSSKGEEKRRESAFFTLNRNKKSIGINLKSAGGRKIFHKMCLNADIVIEGYRPGVVKKLGVDYEIISELNPRIIYCSLSGYGQDGPYRLYPGHDINYISIAGVLGLIGSSDGPPAVPLNLVADFAGASLYSTIGILLAYIARQKTGKGQYIDHSYLEGAIHLMTWFTQKYFFDGTVIKRGESHVTGNYPYYAVYETKDAKYISLGCIEPHFWENLLRYLEREEYVPYGWIPEDTYHEPNEKHKEIFDFLGKAFLLKTRDEWFDILSPKNIPVGKVYALDEVFTDSQVIHRKMLIEIDDPRAGKVKQIGVLPKLSDTPGKVRTLAPLHGEHTDSILLGIGYSPEEIKEFRRNTDVG